MVFQPFSQITYTSVILIKLTPQQNTYPINNVIVCIQVENVVKKGATLKINVLMICRKETVDDKWRLIHSVNIVFAYSAYWLQP